MKKITKSDMTILERIYLYGRGYTTEKLLTPFFDHTSRYIQLKLNELREKGLLNVLKNKQCFVYKMTAEAIELFGRDDYLVRMKKRNEHIELVQDKLTMLNFVGVYRRLGFKFVNHFDKVELFKRLYKIDNDAFSALAVFGSNQIFFNDVMMVPDGGGPENLHIVLFPRFNIFPSTYLKSHLIKQYLNINFIMRQHDHTPKILIVTSSSTREQLFKREINQGLTQLELNSEDYSEEVVDFYDKNNSADLFTITLDKFDIETVLVPYPHAILE